MKSVLAFALLVGVVAAFGGSTSFYGWRPEHEFTYRFESQVLTGIPQIRNQYSGLKLTSNVLIQTKSDYSLIVKFLNPKFVVVNQELQLRQGRPIIPAPHEDIPEPLGKYLKESFQVNLKAGVVESFFVEESEPVVVTNIKKSLLSQLQMDLSGIRRSEIPRTNAIPKGNAEEELVGGEGKKTFFSTEESTLNGDCQVDYNMVPLAHYESKNIEAAIKEEELELKVMNILTGPKSEGGEKECEGKQYWSVTKTLNFDNCRQRPVYMSTTGIKSFCDASKSECKDVATQASSSRYIVCGSSPEDFVIRKIEHENSGVGSPLGINTEEKTLTTSYVSLYLVHVKSGGYTPLPRPSGGRKEKTSLVFEYPKEFLSHKAETSGRRPTAESGEFQPLRPMPTLHEASPMYPSALKPSQIQEQVVKQFDIVIENIALSPESCGEKHDLAGIVQSVAMNLRSLNFSELKDLERQIRSHFSSGSKKYELAVNMFYDVLAMVGSNPAVVLLKEKFVERKIEDSQAVALIQNIIRNVRTPTKEIMRELLSLVKTLKSEGMKSTYFSAIVQLSNLVYRACVEPSRAVSEFPVRIYGRFCTKDSEFITHEYIPYLTRSLEHTECPMETMVVISALGKVGHKKALVPLTKAIEGEMGSNKPLARAAAVYALKRVAKREPTLTRPILLSLITNLSESTEVRLAAVAVLPWAQPSVAELQKIAIRSWYEPSKQVASMIYSTLSGLTETVIPELKPVGDKARTLQHLVKPFQYGIQFSHTRHYNKYMPYLRTAGVVSFERIGTEKALVPARASIEHSGFGGLWEINGMTFTVFSEGMDEILAHAINWIEKPTTSENSEEALRDIINKLSIKKRNGDQNAQAFMQFRMFGYEKMFHSDYSTLMKTISDEIRTLSMGGENNPMDYSRALTGFSSQVMVPCSAGFPLYIEIVAPVIYSVKSSISYDSRSLFSGSAKMSFLPVVNTKIYSNVGILSPFTKQFIGAGVELSAHISSPIEVKAEITPRPDVEVTLKFPEQVRKEIEVVHFKVKPYTAVKSLERIGLVSKSSGAKVILSGRPEEIIESPWLSKFGISSSLKVVADYKTYDFAYLYRAFKEQGFATFGLMPMTLKSFDAKVKVDPTQSSTTEVKFRLNLSAGRKASVESALELIQPFGGLPIKEYGEEKELHTLCRTLHTSARKIESCIEKGLKSDTTDLVQDMQEIRQICSSPRFPRSEAGECVEALKTCYRAKNVCDQTISPMEETCMGFRKACINEVKTVQHLIHRSTEMGSGYFHGLNVEASLNSRYGSDSVKAFVVSGVKRGGPRVIETFTELVVETPQTTAFEAELKTVTKVPEVLYRWNLDSLLQQSIDMEFDAAFKAGFASSEKVRINIASKLKKSGAQIESVRNSPEYRKCQQEVQKGRTLSTVCIEARNQAASLNKIDLRVQYPEHLFEICPTTLKIANYIKGCFFPYVSMVNDLENEGETSFGRSRSEIRRELVEEAQRESRYIVGEGQGLQTVSLSGEASRIGDVITMGINTPTGSSVLLKNVRIPQVFHGLVPLSVRNGLFDNVIRKVSQQQEPALCTLDQGHISTFDNRTYQYNLNSCEHLLFQDCSQNRPVAVTAMGTDESGNTKIVKAILGENIVEMKKGSGSSVEVFVNGEIKQIGIGEHYSKQDKRQRVALKIFRTRDEVVSVEAPVEGVIVYFNNERLEIIAPQILFNRACGLCGDLNGENTADLKSPELCLLKHNRIAAYAYMMKQTISGVRGPHSSCPGIPEQDRQTYDREIQECTKAHTVKTPVVGMAKRLVERSPKPTTVKHIIKREENRICFSKQTVKLCSGGSRPVKTVTLPMSFACFRMPSSKGVQLEKRVEAGETLAEIMAKPTVFSKPISQIKECTGDYPEHLVSGGEENYRVSARSGF